MRILLLLWVGMKAAMEASRSCINMGTRKVNPWSRRSSELKLDYTHPEMTQHERLPEWVICVHQMLVF